MANEIPDYDAGSREEMVPVFGASGVEMVPASQLEAWLSSDESIGKRPPGSGPDGRWTLEDEKAAFKIVEENQDFGGKNPYDFLADKLASPEVGYFSEGLKEESARQKLAAKYPDATGIDFDERGGSTVRFAADSAVPFIYSAPEPKAIQSDPNAVPRGELSRTITHPDGFMEFDQEVLPDPERDRVGGNFRAFREGVAKLAFEKEEAKRRGKQDPAPTLGPSMTEQ